MKKALIISLLLMGSLESCKGQMESCIESKMEEDEFTYEEACEYCEEARDMSVRK